MITSFVCLPLQGSIREPYGKYEFRVTRFIQETRGFNALDHPNWLGPRGGDEGLVNLSDHSSWLGPQDWR